MNEMNPKVDGYLALGCGRCALGGTPACRVNDWREELTQLRSIILDCGLTEELKWAHPCYLFGKTNLILLGAFRKSCTLSFLQGALLKDAAGILEKPGENTQAARLVRFTGTREIVALKPVLKDYIEEAVELEKAGSKVQFKPVADFGIPAELQNKLAESAALRTAFEALTPGRRRAYLMYFSQPKQTRTRAARVEKWTPQILLGKGLNDYLS